MEFPDLEVMKLLVHLGAGNKAEPAPDGGIVVYVETKAGVRPTLYSVDALDALEERGWVEIEEDENRSALLTEQGRYAVERWWFKETGKKVNAKHLRPAGRPVEKLAADQRW